MKADRNQPQSTNCRVKEPGGLQFVFTAFAGLLKGLLEHLEREPKAVFNTYDQDRVFLILSILFSLWVTLADPGHCLSTGASLPQKILNPPECRADKCIHHCRSPHRYMLAHTQIHNLQNRHHTYVQLTGMYVAVPNLNTCHSWYPLCLQPLPYQPYLSAALPTPAYPLKLFHVPPLLMTPRKS